MSTTSHIEILHHARHHGVDSFSSRSSGPSEAPTGDGRWIRESRLNACVANFRFDQGDKSATDLIDVLDFSSQGISLCSRPPDAALVAFRANIPGPALDVA